MAIKNGETADADEVMNAFGRLFRNTLSTIWEADYDGWDSRFNYPLADFKNNSTYDKIMFNTMQSDVASTKTNWTYDSTNDGYYTTGGSHTCTLVFDDTAGTTVTNTISCVNGWFETTDGAATNAYFEDAIGGEWTYSESDTNGVFTDSGRQTDMPSGETSGSYSYRIDLASGVNTVDGDYFQVAQSSVNLSNSSYIQVDWENDDSGTSSISMTVYIIVDSTTIASTNFNWDSANSGTIGGNIPVSLRTSGKTVKLKVVQTMGMAASADNNASFWFDSLRIYSRDPSNADNTVTYKISYDGGSNYETFTDSQIQRNANTGGSINRKIEIDHTSNQYAKSYITEEGTIWNWY